MPPPPQPSPEFRFRGGATVLKPCHITRYCYPCLLGHPPHTLILETPHKASQRRRPQGQAAFDPTFLTITRAPEPPISSSDFQACFTHPYVKTKDKASVNPLGRAMRRLTRYPGNTVLDVGKFRFGKGDEAVFIIKRTTVLPLGKGDKGKFGRDEEVYEIPAGRWRGMRVQSEPGHDSWWQRINVGGLLCALKGNSCAGSLLTA